MKVTLDFEKAGKFTAESLSAMVKLGDSLFAGGDEGVKIVRLEERDGGERYEKTDMLDLSKWFDLPKPPPADPTKKVKEIDLEGIDFDPERRLLWMVGSHSLKRSKAESGVDDAENLAELAQVKSDANRFFLGCIPIGGSEQKPRIAEDGPSESEARAAQLRGSDQTSDLLDAIRRDELFARFQDIPGKDNGIDIEGLACAPRGRLLVGLRAPVLRGIAVVLEIRPVPVDPRGKHADRLKLEPIGPGGQLYRRHFLDLAGNGIRDLCWDGNDDLLVLAGPSASLDAPPIVFRWRNAAKALNAAADANERFFWLDEDGDLEIEPLNIDFKQTEVGCDHAETITFIKKKKLAIGYDAPSSAYLKESKLKSDVAEIG